MRPANIKSGYTDTLSRRRRGRFILEILAGLASFIVIGAGLVYGLFFAKALDLRSMSINGLSTLNPDDMKGEVAKVLEYKFMGHIPRKNNLFFLSSENLSQYILSKFPIIKSVGVEKKFPHALILNFKERTAVGTWCFNGLDCKYFDIDGNSWGQAAKSSGFLISSVDDRRSLNSKELDKEYFDRIKIFLGNPAGLHFMVGDIIIEQGSFREFKVNSSDGYPILFSLDSNIPEQIKLLTIFLENKSKETEFKPQYIDLRIDGRVYFK